MRSEALIGLALLLCASVSHADEPQCTPAFERAQELRAKGDRMAAREELLVCAASCGEELRRYCVTWLSEVEAELSSVVLVARRNGKDVPLGEVRVMVDGIERKPERGRIVLEPGQHRIALSHRGATVMHVVELQAGREPTSVVATFPSPHKPRTSQPPPTEPRPTPVATWVLIGLGGAALVAAGVLTLNGHLMRADLKDECAPGCEPDSIVPIERQWIAAGVLAGAGAIALVGAGVVAVVDGDAVSGALTLRARF